MKEKRAWLYYRLSRDEDKELNSLNNQRSVLVDYAEKHGYIIVGESFDDNFSGMNFDREGIDQMSAAAKKHEMDIVLVKDMSRLGRHKTLTALYIDELARNKVFVYSVTEGISTENENDELIMDVKQIFNHQYSKDISRKIRAGYKQKQAKGIVVIPPFGYLKDKNTNTIVIVEECAEIVRTIFKMYADGLGVKKIANFLSEQGYKSPAYYQQMHFDKSVPYNKTRIGKQFLWCDRTVSTIIRNEAYIGTLICRKFLKSTITKTRTSVPEEEQFRHENFYPPIISRDLWNTAQRLIEHRKINNVHSSKNRKIHTYAGILRCGDCDAVFASKVRKNDKDYIEYVCNSYHRMGAKYCSPHRITEEDLNTALFAELETIRNQMDINWKLIDDYLKLWQTEKSDEHKSLIKIDQEIEQTQDLIKEFIIKRLTEPERAQFYDELTKEYEKKLAQLKNQAELFRRETVDVKNVVENNILNSQELIDIVLKSRMINNTLLQMLVQRIIIKQEDKLLHIEFLLNVPFNLHRSGVENDVIVLVKAKKGYPAEIITQAKSA